MTNNTTADAADYSLVLLYLYHRTNLGVKHFLVSIAKDVCICYDDLRGEIMAKLCRCRKNIIASFLAFMLVFCGLCAEGAAACEVPDDVCGQGIKMTLEHPGAGEFFAGSLPQAERQSVRPVSSYWQEVVRTGAQRSFRQLYRLQEVKALLAEQENLGQRIYSKHRKQENSGISSCGSQAIIVCYIHNQDGAKG